MIGAESFKSCNLSRFPDMRSISSQDLQFSNYFLRFPPVKKIEHAF
ncbi:hypothetical protein Xen7305DRAFT_00010810 [Xenococcus sp. PCC 7305]|nr:hypothetical protein Xen7305DRAFT_00010810 [Xenococcus sp. PCC 7305]